VTGDGEGLVGHFGAAVAIVLGATSMNDIALLAHHAAVLGPEPSDTTVRRTLESADPRTLDKVARVRAAVRAHVWSLIVLFAEIGNARAGCLECSQAEQPEFEQPRRKRRRSAYWRVKTAWTTIVLSIDAMPIRFHVRPKSARLTRSPPSSQTSPSAVETFASKDAGRVPPRTVRRPVTWTPSSDGSRHRR